MKKIILIIGIMLIISGCGNEGISDPVAVEYHTGTQGIELSTLSDLPPSTVFEKSEFVVGVQLKNLGASDVTDGVVVITGLDPKYTSIENEQDYFEAKGKSPSFPEGGLDIKYFKLKNIWFPVGKEQQKIPFTVIADYGYKTEAKAEVCINPDLYNYMKSQERLCEVKDVSLSGGQGAPLAVTLVQPSISLSAANLGQLEGRFGINIQNKGNGEVIGDLSIIDAKLGNNEMVCTNVRKEGEENKKWYVSCSIELSSKGESYTSPVTLIFSYRYRTRVNKEVLLRTVVQ